jgi:L-malate glycosyltransferase
MHMKICHVVYSLEMGGAEVLVAQLCRIQRAHGHNVSVCAYSKLGPIGEQLQAEGFEIYVPGEAHPARTMLRYLAHFRKLRPDVVHCHNPAPTLQAALSARLGGAARVLATRHSLVAPPYDRAAEIKFSVFARFCDWITGVCETTSNNLRHAPLAATSRIVTVYNGVSPVQPVAESAPARDDFTLLFIGRVAVIKDLPTMLRAVAIAVEKLPNLKLWVVGDGPVRNDLEAIASQLGISGNVRFWGQQMDTARFYNAADAFIMSSVSEGVPMSLLQAMSVGLPAVLTDVGGMGEVIRLSQSGLLSPVGDAQAMADSIVEIATNTSLRAEFSRRARSIYEEFFTLAKMDAAYMDLYQRSR